MNVRFFFDESWLVVHDRLHRTVHISGAWLPVGLGRARQ